MTTRTIARLCAGILITVTAFMVCGVAGLWGVALAAPALLFAPSAVRGGVERMKTKRQMKAELATILGGGRENRS